MLKLKYLALNLILAPSVALLLLACGQPPEEPAGTNDVLALDRALVDAPVVGDIYAAELTYFSEADFEGQPVAYGLLKVVAVDQDKVTVITENAGSASAARARKDLLGEMGAIEFDRSEQIDIVHGELARAHEAGKIIAVRR